MTANKADPWLLVRPTSSKPTQCNPGTQMGLPGGV
jgi:hypothetical protein